jgi:hypothetical protein
VENDRRIVSEDLPLLLCVAAVTFVVSSLLSATPQVALLSVLGTTLLADVIKNRGWGRKALLAITGVLTAGWTARETLRSQAASAPSATSMCLTAGLASVITVGAVTGIEYVRDDALLVDRPTTFLSSEPATNAVQAGSRSPEAAITAYAERERWADRGWDYAGDCAALTTPREVVCSARWQGADAPSEHAYFIAPAFSDVHYLVLALERSDGRWRVDRELTNPR